MSTPTAGSFPVSDLLPKKETNAASFLQKYPTYDGRGTVIGIFDTGIDPGAPGLQVTSDGKPKITHLINCSGTGDVNTSTVVKAENGTIKGLTGRTLKIPESWKNPSGDYHIGVKQAYHIFPKSLKSKCQREWREKKYDPLDRIAAARAHTQLNTFREKNEKDDKNVDIKSKLTEAELEASQDLLSTISKNYKDLGPTWDCVVFHDGTSWKAAVDISETGDLDKTTLLSPYSESYKYATIEEYWLNYSVNIYDSGNLLEIVTTCGSHGTHVAAIAAACFPDDPSRNGIAPGAQIVSINIGDHHLGSMETVNSLTRAAIRIAQLGVDVINMSYGEPSDHRSSSLQKLLDQLVYKHNILFCIAAGNEGVGLSTIGAPSSHAIINIGAYLGTSMMQSQYSMCKSYEGSPYNFTSRGPTFDGALGPSVCAPGGAIASVPNYELSSYQLMNGTSMACPNAAGCFALLVSALKQESIAYSTFSVRRAVENTAMKPSHYEAFAMGHGLLQVDKAFEHLKTHQNLVEQNVDFRSTVNNGILGIYRRKAKCDAKYESVGIALKPFFLNEDEHRSLQDNKLNLELLLQSDKEWVEVPSYLQLSHVTRSFEIKLHPSSLSTGAHLAMVRAYDTTNVEKGPLFHIPVTYVVADSFHDCKYFDKSENVASYPPLSLSPGVVERIFVKPPTGANIIHVTLKNLGERDASLRCSFTQLVADSEELSHKRAILLKEQAKETIDVTLNNESVVEVSISKSCLSVDGDSTVSAQISFSSVQVVNATVPMHSGESIHRVDILPRHEDISANVKVTLDKAITYVRPNSSKITQLTERELIAPGKQLYENLLTYTFTVPAAVDVQLYLTDIKGTLYNSEVFCQLVMLYDKNKRFIDAFDSFKTSPLTIEKGTYTARAHIWHHSKDYLKKLEKAPLRVQQKLSDKCDVPLYSSLSDAINRATKNSSLHAAKGSVKAVYALAPTDDNLQKVLLAPGSVLSGSLTLKSKSKASPATLLNSKFACVLDTVPTAKSNDKESAKKSTAGEKDAKDKVCKDDHLPLLLEMKLSFLESLDDDGKAALLKEIDEAPCEATQVSPVNVCKIKAVEANTKLGAKEKNARIVHLADQVINSVNLIELLGSLEMTKVQVQVGTVKGADMKKVEKSRDQLIQAFIKKGIALSESLDTTTSDGTAISEDEKENILNQLESIWLNVNNLLKGQLATSSDLKQTGKFLEAFYRTRGDTASHLKLLLKMQSELDASVDVEKKIIELASTRDEWSHVKAYYERCINAKFPVNFLTV